MTTYKTNWTYVKAMAGYVTKNKNNQVTGVVSDKALPATSGNMEKVFEKAIPAISRDCGMHIDNIQLV